MKLEEARYVKSDDTRIFIHSLLDCDFTIMNGCPLYKHYINKTKHKPWLDLFGTYSYSLTILPLYIFGVIKLKKKNNNSNRQCNGNTPKLKINLSLATLGVYLAITLF